ncbi:hypothetical protein GCM10020256_02070 [Streptomyces thermocoprophilus]
MVESDDLPVASDRAGPLTFDDQSVSEVSLHGDRPLGSMVMCPRCHPGRVAAWGDRPRMSGVRAGPNGCPAVVSACAGPGAAPAQPVISTRCVLPFSVFGTLTVSTPFVSSALTCSVSAFGGRVVR